MKRKGFVGSDDERSTSDTPSDHVPGVPVPPAGLGALRSPPGAPPIRLSVRHDTRLASQESARGG